MTWGTLQLLTKGLLSGDYDLPEDEEVRVALLQMAMEQVCNSSSPVTLSYPEGDDILEHREIVRQFEMSTKEDPNTGMMIRIKGYIIRPLLPSTSNDVIDIDEGLTYAVARLMAGYVANIENKRYHTEEATRIIEMYKVNVVSLYDRWNSEVGEE